MPTPKPTDLITSAVISANGDPSVGIPDTHIHVSGFVIDPADDDDTFRDYLEACRAKLVEFGALVTDERVSVEFDFEIAAANQQIEDAALAAATAEAEHPERS